MSNNNGGGPSKRKAVFTSRIPRYVRPGSGDAGFVTPKSVSLTKGAIYRFHSWNVGTFRIRGGSSGGKFHVDGFPVAIYDFNGNVIFSHGGLTDRVFIKDDLEEGTTSVTLNPQDESGGVVSYSNINITGKASHTFPSQGTLCDTGKITITSAGNASITFGRSTAAQEAIPIQAYPNDRIFLRGNRDFVITGNGAMINTDGSCNVTVHGNPQSVTQTGTGDHTIHGEIEGNVFQTGGGNIVINGNIKGAVNQCGSGNLHVYGVIAGGVTQAGAGNIDVYGANLGSLYKVGFGNVRFHQTP